MDCVLRVIEGPDQGMVYEPLPGENVIGRGATAHMKLTAPEVSYEHAVLTRNGEGYFIQNLSALGTFVEETKVTAQLRLRAGEKIRLSSETVLRIEPASGNAGVLANRGMLWSLVVLGVGAVLVLMVWNPLSPPEKMDDWENAVDKITPWLKQEIKAQRLPAEMFTLFQEAWRREQMKDYANSYPGWLRLQLLVDRFDERLRFTTRSQQSPRALQNLLTPLPNALPPDGDQCAAAFAQFVSRRLAWSIKQNQLAKPGLKLSK